MGGSSKAQTVGYWYEMGQHLGLSHGPVDAVLEIRGGDRTGWSGEVTDNEQIYINAPDLFGGQEREGGIQGYADIMMGGPDQGANDYLASQQGTPQPAYRGLLSLVFRRGKITANNPYIKPWAVRVRRILKGWAGGSPWYPDKAGILIPGPGLMLVQSEIALDAQLADVTGANGVTLTGFLTTDVVTITQPSGLTYGGWSRWPADDDPNASGLPWECSFRVRANGVETDYLTSRYATQAAALAAAQASPVILTGASSYTIWLYDDVLLNRGGVSLRVHKTPAAAVAMNPAHIVYECLTNPEWGLGYPAGKIDAASFAEAADTFHAEGLGLCMQWSRQDAIQGFVQAVVDHAGAVCGEDPRTGLFKLKAIRADYDVEDLRVFSAAEGNIISLDGFERATLTETINELTVSYTDAMTGKEGSVTVQQLANIQAQGAVVPQSRAYPGLPTMDLAVRTALRDLRAAASALARVRLTVTRDAYDLQPGDVIAFSWPELSIELMALRIGKVDYGSLTNGQIKLECVEDVFGLPAASYINPQPIGWVEPSRTPQASPAGEAFEVPYRELLGTLGAAETAALAADAGFVAVVAARPGGNSINYELRTRVSPTAYAQASDGDWCPTGVLSAYIGPLDTSLVLSGAVDLESIEVGSAVLVGDEICRVDSVDVLTSTLGVGRGCADTVPQAWPSGTRIWAFDLFGTAAPTEYADGETVDTKVLTRTTEGLLEENLAPVRSVSMASRAARPYPPGLLRITDDLVTGAAYPTDAAGELLVSWAHRDRVLQQDTLIDENDASIGPEAGTTYTVRFYLDDVLEDTQTGITGTSATPYTFAGAGLARVEVEAVRDGLVSWQPALAEFNYLPAPADFRVTDAGDDRITDSGDRRITE
jgi:hypothetical protein